MSRIDDRAQRTTDPDQTEITPLANHLEEVIHKSGIIAWYGIFAGTDRFGRPAAEVYFSERRRAINPDPQVTIIEVGDAMDDLALAMEPQVLVTSHFVRQRDFGTRALKRTLREKGADDLAQGVLVRQQSIRRRNSQTIQSRIQKKTSSFYVLQIKDK